MIKKTLCGSKTEEYYVELVNTKKSIFDIILCVSISKAYIPLRHKIPGVGGWRWAMPLTPECCVGDTNMLVYFGVT